MTEEGETINVEVVSVDKYITVIIKNDLREEIPTLDLRWVRKGDNIFAVYPAANGKEEILLSSSDLQTCIKEKRYGILLHSFTILEDVFFETGRTSLTPASRQRLLPLLGLLSTEDDYHLTLSVHTDSSGTPAANRSVSQRRAASIQKYFTESGIDPDRIEVIGKGLEEPLYHEKSQQLKNRRVELRIPQIKNVNIIYAEEPVMEELEPEVIANDPDIEESVAPPSAPAPVYRKPKGKRKYSWFSFTIGAKAGQILERESNNWSSQDGIGLWRHYGGDLNLNFRVKKSIGVLLNVGFLQSSVNKNYVSAGVHQYKSTETLRQIPVQLGLRVHFFKVMYLQASGGPQLLQIGFSTSGSELYGDNSYKNTDTKLGYGGAVGFEFLIGKLLFDLSGHYNNLLTDGFYGSTSSMPTVGVRLGAGLNHKSNR